MSVSCPLFVSEWDLDFDSCLLLEDEDEDVVVLLFFLLLSSAFFLLQAAVMWDPVDLQKERWAVFLSVSQCCWVWELELHL